MAKKKNGLHGSEAHNYAGLCRDMTEDEAEALFAEMRWGSTTEQGCPGTDCGSFRRHYRLKRKRRWRCADCGHEFSATSRTAFHARKLSYRRLLGMLVLYDSGAKGRSLCEASRDVGTQIKTMQANFGKVREMLVNSMDLSPLKGLIHMDGIHLGGKPRKPNNRVKPTSEMMKAKLTKGKGRKFVGMSRANQQRRKNRRVVLSLCLAGQPGEGISRCLAFVTNGETEQNVKILTDNFVESNSMIWSDENPAYGRLQGTDVEHYAVPHSSMFCTPDGVNNNLAESWNSRIRRYEYGVGHGFRPKYMQDYVCEMVWRENFRRESQQTKIQYLLRGLMQAPPSRWWKGYFQGHHREGELTVDYFLERLGRQAA